MGTNKSRNEEKLARPVLNIILVAFLSSSAPASFFEGGLPAPSVLLPPLPTPHIDFVSYSSTLEKSEQRCPDTSCRLWHRYVLASFATLTDPKKGCDILDPLSREKRFPLYPFVLMKMSKACTKNRDLEAKILKALEEFSEKKNLNLWVRQELALAEVDAAYASASEKYFERVFDAANLARNKKVKTTLFQNALIYAQSLKSSMAKDIQRELFKVAPRLEPHPTDWVAVAHDAYSNHDYALAVKAYEKALKKKNQIFSLKRLMLENLKTSYKAIQKRNVALKTSARLWKLEASTLSHPKLFPDGPKHYLSSGLSYVRFLWTDHHDKQALKVLEIIEKKLKSKTPLGELYFLKSRIYEEQNKSTEAILWNTRALQAITDPSLKSSYGWKLAWMHFKLKNDTEAKNLLEQLSNDESDLSKKSQELFWLAKTDQRLNNTSDANGIFEKITTEDPLSYYALLSYRELGRDIPQPKTIVHESLFSKLPRRLPVRAVSDWTLFDWLISTGELEWARSLLDEEAPLPEGVPDGWEEIFVKYAQAEYYAPIFSRVNKLTSSEKLHLLAKNGDLIFPRKWSDFVNQGSHKSGLWPEFIFSIIRQESSFDPLAISPANAYGLMQILPGVPLEQGVKKKNASPAELLDPQNNVLWGSAHLRKYWDIFGGQFLLSTAAYNASVDVVKSWLKTRYQGDPLVFIEDIPYEETRGYVKLVLRNFINYQRMASNSSIPFPEWCLDGIQVSSN